MPYCSNSDLRLSRTLLTRLAANSNMPVFHLQKHLLLLDVDVTGDIRDQGSALAELFIAGIILPAMKEPGSASWDE
ncbi:hypothetical protein BTUL_0043g00280 [Botrytis tulipae]|uniref:Uncharacterized protein n=1 Tax=Botrytis tulipae TaxID=87230 RepID=A0A4Z1ESF4_9HELO|nr:hypothetical protein BTUL_0043g00280 [Botrytis tulipae]